MKKKLPVVTFATESCTVLNKDHDSLGVIFMDGGGLGVLFEPSGCSLTADEMSAIAAQMYTKEQAPK